MAANPVEFPASPLQVETSTEDNRAVVRCYGKLTGEGSPLLKEEVKRLLPKTKNIVLDLSDLKYMDSSGLAALVSIYVSTRTAGSQLRLVNLNQRVAELLRLTKLASVFEGFGEHL